MMIFFKNQTKYIIILFLVFVIPLGLFFQFSPYPLPKLQYYILGILYLSQYVFYKETVYRSKIEQNVIDQLTIENKKIPSKNDIVIRQNIIVVHRFYSLIISSLGILVLMVFYKQF